MTAVGSSAGPSPENPSPDTSSADISSPHTAAAGVESRVETTGASPAPGIRATRQRAAVAAALDSVDEFRSAQDLHEMLRHQGENVGLSTVYRTLTGLADSGQVDVLRTPGGESVYRRCSARHHHHLVCRSCGATVEVAGPAVERWAARTGREHGYVDTTHTVEIFGTCAVCAASPETT